MRFHFMSLCFTSMWCQCVYPMVSSHWSWHHGFHWSISISPPLPAFISTDAEIAVLVGHFLCPHTLNLCLILLCLFVPYFYCHFLKVSKWNLFKLKDVENNLPQKYRRMGKLGHSASEWCVWVPDTELTEAHPLQLIRQSWLHSFLLDRTKLKITNNKKYTLLASCYT